MESNIFFAETLENLVQYCIYEGIILHILPTHLKAAGFLIITPLELFLHGWDFTGIKIAGTDRACNASLRMIA